MRIKNYQSIFADDLGLLDIEVKKYIRMGWQPLGGISYDSGVINEDDAAGYLQAMVKYEEEPVKTEVKERKVVDVLIHHSDHKWRVDNYMENEKDLGFELLSLTENNSGSQWRYTLKMVKYEI